MELDLYFEICQETVVSIMLSVVLIVITICMMKHAIIDTKCKGKQVKEAESDDNRGNQKRSSKTDVH